MELVVLADLEEMAHWVDSLVIMSAEEEAEEAEEMVEMVDREELVQQESLRQLLLLPAIREQLWLVQTLHST